MAKLIGAMNLATDHIDTDDKFADAFAVLKARAEQTQIILMKEQAKLEAHVAHRKAAEARAPTIYSALDADGMLVAEFMDEKHAKTFCSAHGFTCMDQPLKNADGTLTNRVGGLYRP